MAVTVKVGAIGAVPVEIGESESIGLGIGDKVYIKGDPGEPGFSPVITITELNHAHEVTITDEQGTQSFTVFDGEGVGIENAELNEDYTLTLYYTDGTSYTTPPIRGEQGATGPAGETGSDGTTFTPSVSSAGIISWTNDGGKTNPDPVDVKGPQGNPGTPGQDGADGEDGFSPTVSVTAITGGHRVSVTDATGTDNFDVMDGVDGATGPAGPGVPTGGATGQRLVKASGTDYDTAWQDIPSPALYFQNAAVSATTGDIATVSNASITSDYVLAECVFANPSSITTDVTWTTSSGSLVLNGTCTAATTANIVLVLRG